MSDEVIWQIINQQFCAFKIKTTKDQNFCRNEYNVSGLCNRQSCPLANARYATVKNVEGKLYLYMKTAERAHTPKNLWERIKLSKNYTKAREQIDNHLLYWNKFQILKCKQRLTRLMQVAIQERREALKEEERHYVGVKHKVKRREQGRERKALAAARIEKAIEKELLERLKSGAYGDKPLNVDEKIWQKVLGSMDQNNEDELEDEDEDDVELVSENEDDESDVGEVEYVEADEDEDEFVDMEDLEKWLGQDSDASANSSDDSSDESESDSDDESSSKKRKKVTKQDQKRRRPRLEIEIEEEPEPLTNIAAH